jgi:hypothetical protein
MDEKRMKLADQIMRQLTSTIRSNAYDIIIPNFYFKWHEIDLFRVLKSGYTEEYEIKISRSDYKVDFNKGTSKMLKHDEIKQGKRTNRFYFVVPENMVSVNEVPSYAGLMYFKDGHIWISKAAPLIHKRKVEMHKELAQRLSFREQVYRNRIMIKDQMIWELKEQIKNLKK